jgi:hypothetical protein
LAILGETAFFVGHAFAALARNLALFGAVHRCEPSGRLTNRIGACLSHILTFHGGDEDRKYSRWLTRRRCLSSPVPVKRARRIGSTVVWCGWAGGCFGRRRVWRDLGIRRCARVRIVNGLARSRVDGGRHVGGHRAARGCGASEIWGASGREAQTVPTPAAPLWF